jgi:hypothetical protein
MSRRNDRKMELVALSHPLGRYARSLQPDVNAALLVVHRVLTTAMAEEPRRRSSVGLESSLRADIADISERRARAGI